MVGLGPCRLLKPYILGYPGGLPGPLGRGRRVRLVALDWVPPAVQWVLHPSPLWCWWHSPILRHIMGHGIPTWHQTWWLGGVLLATCKKPVHHLLSREMQPPSTLETSNMWRMDSGRFQVLQRVGYAGARPMFCDDISP
jgi:hypothetical protein